MKKRALPAEDPTSLGNLLVKAGVCTTSQLHEAITIKRDQEDQLLGEVMVRMGVLTRGMLSVVLEQQQLLRTHGHRKAVRYAQTAAKSTAALSGSLVTLNELVLQAITKLKA